MGKKDKYVKPTDGMRPTNPEGRVLQLCERMDRRHGRQGQADMETMRCLQ